MIVLLPRPAVGPPPAGHSSLTEALEKRRHLVQKRLYAAFEPSTAAIFRGAQACLQRELCPVGGSLTAGHGNNLWNSTSQEQEILVYLTRMDKIRR